jgi:tetratricopeptide (TPR) repeat protein
MKFTSAILLFFAGFSSFGQELAMARNGSAEPVSLYLRANESLMQGDTRRAIHIYKEVVEFYQDENRRNELPESYLGMALSFALTGHYPESIRYHKKALRAHRKYRSKEAPVEILINMGLAYHLAGKEKKSRKYLQ